MSWRISIRAKSRFSANIHHELRTPLTLILAPLDSLRAGEFGSLPEAVERMFATMHANGRRLHKMINNLLDLSKVESEQFTIHRRAIRLAPMVDELVMPARRHSPIARVSRFLQVGFSELPEINAGRGGDREGSCESRGECGEIHRAR